MVLIHKLDRDLASLFVFRSGGSGSGFLLRFFWGFSLSQAFKSIVTLFRRPIKAGRGWALFEKI